MVNWKTCRIASISENKVFYWEKVLNFWLDDSVSYRDGCENWISIVGHPEFTSWQAGDTVEIDLDKTKSYGKFEIWGEAIRDPNSSVIRKVSSAVVPSSSSNQQMTTSQFWEIGNRMMDRAERSGGEYEAAYTAQEEQRTDGSVSRQVSWVYRKKN